MVFTQDDVDICVTCVAKSPPKLPLREELISLGVEVIYKAKGIGESAALHESKKHVKEFRQMMKKKKRCRMFPSKSREERMKKLQKQRQAEKMILRDRKSVTYEEYLERLNRTGSEESDSMSSLYSMATLATNEESHGASTLASPATEQLQKMASVVEDREAAEDRREQAFAQSQAVVSSYQNFHQAEISGREGVIIKSPSYPPSPEKPFLHANLVERPGREGMVMDSSNFHLSPETRYKVPTHSAATSPTMSPTLSYASSYNGTVISPSGIHDDDSEGSTYEKDEDRKELVSATGERWWYEQKSETQQIASRHQIQQGSHPHRNQNSALRHHSQALTANKHSLAPPTLPLLDADSKPDLKQVMKAHAKQEAAQNIDQKKPKSSWCGLGVCGWGQEVVDFQQDPVVVNNVQMQHVLDKEESIVVEKPVITSSSLGSNSKKTDGLVIVGYQSPDNDYLTGEFDIDVNEGMERDWDEPDWDQHEQPSPKSEELKELLQIASSDSIKSIIVGDEELSSIPERGNTSYCSDDVMCQACEEKSHDAEVDHNEMNSPIQGNVEESETPLLSPKDDSTTSSDGSSAICSGGVGRVSKFVLFSTLSATKVDIDEIQKKFHSSPSLARARSSRHDSRVPLHAACDRILPNRFEGKNFSLLGTLDRLRNDVIEWRAVVEAVLGHNVEACTIVDKKGDLPVHIAARRLIEWEGRWRTQLGGDKVLVGLDAESVDKLHHEMAQAIEILLDPILLSRSLCRKRGSIGRILPIHIACIFPVAIDKMSTLLQTYPEAAGVPCDLGDLLSHVVNYSLPLELLERDRTVGASIDVNDSEKNLSSEEVTRSDLLFAHYPNIDPFRFEPTRLARLELMIKKAARKLQHDLKENSKAKMEVAAQAGWVWLCTYNNITDGSREDYSKNVKNIVNGLAAREVKLLSQVKIFSGTVIESATAKCAEIINAGLASDKLNDSSSRKDEHQFIQTRESDISVESATSSLTESFFRIDNSPQDALSEASSPNYNVVGAFIKTIFNVHEFAHPTSFIILPYKLVEGADGALTLDTPMAAPTAIKFAKYLLEMTQPNFLSHQLEKKSIQHGTYRLSVDRMEEWTLTEEKHRNVQREFVNIYRDKPAYLYLLDEKDGVPIIKGERAEKYYPIRIEESAETVRRLFSLMLMGMVHMRGEKSLGILMKTIVETGLPVPKKWVNAADDILDLLTAEKQDQDTILSAALTKKGELDEFVRFAHANPGSRRNLTTDGYEWVVELTLLKLTLERSDIRRSFAGLKAIKMPNGEVIWSKSTCLQRPIVMRKERRDSIDSLHSSSGTESILGIQGSFSTDTKVLDNLLQEEVLPTRRNRLPPSMSRDPSPVPSLTSSWRSARSSRASSRDPSPAHTRGQRVASIDNRGTIFSQTFREQLEKQEAHLNNIRDRLNSFDISDSDQVSLRGEDLVDDLSQQLSVYDASTLTVHDTSSATTSTTTTTTYRRAENEEDNVGKSINDGESESEMDSVIQSAMDGTKKLMLRLCRIEEQLLSREIDLQQIKLDIHNFELESIHHANTWDLAISQLDDVE